MMICELGQVFLVQRALEFVFEIWRILCAHTKRNDRSSVAQNRVTDLRFELMEVLVGDREANPVLTQFRKHVDECERCEALELIDVDEEVPATCRGRVRATERSETYRRHQEATQKRRAVLTKTALGEVHQKHSAAVHDLSNVQIP